MGTDLQEFDRPYLEFKNSEGDTQFFELRGLRLSIGRTDENDILLPSESVSRQHAFLERDRQGNWKIRDNESKNGVIVNGKKGLLFRLKSEDRIQIGEYSLVFKLPSDQFGELVASPAAKTARGGGAPNRRPLIYGVVILALAGLAMMMMGEEPAPEAPSSSETANSTDPGKKMASQFDTEKQPEMIGGPRDKSSLPGIEDPLLKDAEVELNRLDWNDGGLKEAEQFFRRGQREYMNHNYSRAIEAFRTALTLQKNYTLASKYLQLVVYESEREAKKQLEIGLRYFDGLQYQRAIYHLKQVESLMSHRPNEPIIGEAERYIQIATKKLQSAELFP